MLNTIFATKRGMSQAWTTGGKRVPVTKCEIDDNIVVGKQECIAINRDTSNLEKQPCLIFEIGYGKKKLKNLSKPLREKIKQSGFSFGVKQIKGVKLFDYQADDDQLEVGQSVEVDRVLEVGDVVKVTGVSKGKGFSGVVKRYNFAGGPRTHGQRDRERSGGSIGAMTDPGRVLKGKKMPGRMGGEQSTVLNLVVVHIDPNNKEIWLSGPIPGHFGSIVRVTKTGGQKQIELDQQASGIEAAEPQAEADQAGQDELEAEADSKQESESETVQESVKDEQAEETEAKPKEKSEAAEDQQQLDQHSEPKDGEEEESQEEQTEQEQDQEEDKKQDKK